MIKIEIGKNCLRFLLVVLLAFVYALMLWAYLGASPANALTRTPTKAKNVIMIQTDHELSYLHGTENDTYRIKRPSYDKFRGESVDFVNAKSINPLCSPARRSMLTATYPHQHGIITNKGGIAPNPNEDTIYDVLLQNGFDNGNMYFYGKTHWSGGISSQDTPIFTYGTRGWACEGYGQPYKTQKYKNYLAANDYFGSDERQPVMTLEAEPLNANPSLKKGDKFNIANMNIITGNYFGIMDAPKEFHEAFFLADMVNAQLQDIAERPDEPFVMSVNFWGPHHPYYPTKEFVDLYTDEDGNIGGNIPEYPSFRDTFLNKPKVYAWDGQAAGNPNLAVPNVKSWEEFRVYMALAYAQTTLVDRAIGTILDTIDATGLGEDTVVIWTNDHGDALGSHGGHSDKECYMTEEILDINMTVRHPDYQGLAGTVNTSYVNTADVPVTMLDVLGYEFPKKVAGKSLLGLLDGSEKPREYMVCETNGHFTDTRARSVYYDGFKYTYYLNDIDELYDLTNDKFEMNNLIFEAEMQGRVALMKRMLREWQQNERDTIPLVNL